MPSDSVRPEALPTQFEHVRTGRGTPVDLNGDGTDEHLVRVSQNGLPSPQKFNALLLESGSRTVIDQVNYAHPIGQPHTADVTGDGAKEVFVPLVRNDSLFLSIVTADGTKRNQIYVTEGAPRQEPSGTLPWDPMVKDVFWTDTDGNGTRELLTLVQTRYARLPRGVWIHELPSGQLLGKKVVGAPLDRYKLGNFDDDPHRELLVAAGAPNNGAKAGGMSDKHAYIYAFNLGRPPSVQWKHKTGSKYVKPRLKIGDLDGDGVRDYVVFERSSRGRIEPTRFRLIDPGTGETQRASKFPFSAAKSVTADADEDGRDEVLVLDRSGTVHMLGAMLAEEERVDFGSRAKGIDRVPDVTGDGNAEVLLNLGNRTLMLGPDLRIRATVSKTGSWRRVHRGPNTQPFLRVDHGEGTAVYKLVPNRWYWLYRWGPWVLGLLAVGLLLVGGYGAWNKYREYHRLRALQESTVAAIGTPLLLCREGDSRVRPLNHPARRWLRQSKGSREEDFPEELASENGRSSGPLPNGETGSYSDLPPSLAAWIENLDGGTEQAYEAEFPGNGSPQSTRVYAQAVSTPTILGDDSCWLLRVVPPGHQADLDSRRTWRLMAQRIAHDLRNPLTSIRLALQSMQMDYRESETDVAGTLDVYIEQIDQQIESLRRSATNVMKLVGAEEQNALETDLSSFLRREGQQLAEDLPDDVELRWEVADDLPVVSVDREQMTSVLENLVYNAVEALPEGGTITVQTQLARNLSLSPGEGPRDYVIVEVMDTGAGMNASTQARAFDPGFTTTANGTGLGLAMVKRIIEDHDGQVELESEPGIGTDVRVYLPTDDPP